MVCLAVHEKWVVDAGAIWLVAGLVVLLASVSVKRSRVSGRLVRHQVHRLRSRQRGSVGVTVVRISVSLLDSSPDHAPRCPIQVETQEPPYGKSAVFTGVLTTTEAPA